MDVVASINAMQSGDTLTVKAGHYLIETDQIVLKPHTKLILHGVTLEAIPNAKKRYFLIRAVEPGITIVGGTLVGDRDEHGSNEGQWGFGIEITKGARDILVDGTTSIKMWGDGFYIGGGEDIRLINVLAKDNRRQGLSIVHGKNIQVIGSAFMDTKGTAPEAGIDVEPDEKAKPVENVLISGCVFRNNNGHGVVLHDAKGPIRNARVVNCDFIGNKKAPLKARSAWSWWEKLLFDWGLWEPTSVYLR